MLKLTLNNDVKERLLEILKDEDDADSAVRIREYTTGTPCCRKTVLGFTIDEKDDDDDSFEVDGIPFIVNNDIVEKWGNASYIGSMDEHGNPSIVKVN